MSDTTTPGDHPEPALGPGFFRKEIAVPVVVAVLGTLLVGALTPIGDGVRELLFPTKAVVIGTAVVGGQPAVGADLVLDGDHAGETDERGGFRLRDVGNGTHTLELIAPEAHPRLHEFVVEREATTLDLGVIDLSSLLQLRYYLPTPVPETGFTPTLTLPYDLILWIEGDPEALNRVQSVSYTLPAQLLNAPVTRRALRRQFCFHTKGDLGFQDMAVLLPGEASVATALVDLGQGQSITLYALPSDIAPRFLCPLAPGGPSTSPSPFPSPTPSPSPSPSPTPSPSPSEQSVMVPDVVCRSYAAAKSELEGLGLAPILGEPVLPNPACPNANNVAQQDTPPGSTVAAGSVIVLHKGMVSSPGA